MLPWREQIIEFPGGRMNAVSFGKGPRPMLLISGLNLRDVRGPDAAFGLWALYRGFGRDHTVWCFDRREDLPVHYSLSQIAEDTAAGMEALGLRDADVLGVSQGGMIAQWLAIDYPEKVEKLVLTVTCARPNDTAREAIGRWIEMAERGDYRAIMLDTAERSYSPKRRPTAVLTAKLMGNYGRPESFDRFLTQAESCLTHDAEKELGRISCPTLVIGGTDDRVVTGVASHEIASRIAGSRMKLYQGLGHALYEEAPDFLELVRDFCV